MRKLEKMSGHRPRVHVEGAGRSRNWNPNIMRYRQHRRIHNRWKPNEIHHVYNPRAGSNYVYMTDGRGRVSRAEGRLVLNKGSRHRRQQQMAGTGVGRPGDHGGHLFGTRFGGAGEGINMVPMTGRLNSGGRWQAMEDQWERELLAGNQVDVKIVPKYQGDGERPDWFKVTHTVTEPNGGSRTVTQVFANR
ncbi:DNA/RNA non-specific endonuclease [Actinopolymorpha sp. B9G3]|uniref:DNA/RNA non-specific endonuclease n=2 Tax=Actinopolymorpha TaxID=117156 RepID=UPI0032D95756